MNFTTNASSLSLLASFLFLGGVQGATITSGSIVSNVSAPSGGLGGGVSNSVRVSSSPTLIKFVGDINITTAGGGSTLDNTLDIGGALSLDAQEAFILSYDFAVTILGGGTFEFTVTGTTDFDGRVETVSNTESFSGPGAFEVNFSELGFIAEESVSGNWSGQLSFNWLDAPSGSSLNIVIPNESIDFEVGAIPEPSMSALTLLGAMGLLASRRRR